MTYPELCDQMKKTGFLSHSAACCVAKVTKGMRRNGKPLLKVKLLKSTDTFRMFSQTPHIKRPDTQTGASAILRYITPTQDVAVEVDDKFLVFEEDGMVMCTEGEDKDKIGALSDFKNYLIPLS